MNLSRVKKSTLVRSTLFRSTTHSALQLKRRWKKKSSSITMSIQLLLAKVCFNDFYHNLMNWIFIRCKFQITGDHLFNSSALIHDVSISAKIRTLQKWIICLHFNFYQVENGITSYSVLSDHFRTTE